MEESAKVGARVVEQACAVLLAIAGDERRRDIRSFADELGISKTTLQRILVSLENAGFVRCDPSTQVYSLTSSVLQLSAGFHRHQDLLSLCRPHMERLRQLTGETVCLSIEADAARVTLAQLESRHELRLSTEVGRRYPLVTGATGRVLMSLMLPQQLDATLEKYASGDRSVPAFPGELDVEAVRKLVEQTRAEGYAQSHGEWLSGGTGLAVPIASPFGNYVALSLYGPENRLSPEACAEFLPALLSVARELSTPTPGDA
jgi:DNA-binding IclR family transcriptional regulator